MRKEAKKQWQINAQSVFGIETWKIALLKQKEDDDKEENGKIYGPNLYDFQSD